MRQTLSFIRASQSSPRSPPTGRGWAHELKHDVYRLQIHVRDGRVRLFTMNGADWSKRYPRIVEESARIKGNAVMEAEIADGKRVGRICTRFWCWQKPWAAKR